MKHINTSPIDNSELELFISCKDHSNSKENFTIMRDHSADFLVTSPRPGESDLAKYYDSEDYISHTDSKKSLLDKVYQLVRNHTLKQKLKLINSFGMQEKSILDFGAGTGDFLNICQQGGWQVEGVEPNIKAKNVADEKLSKTLMSNISDIGRKKFDVITNVACFRTCS